MQYFLVWVNNFNSRNGVGTNVGTEPFGTYEEAAAQVAKMQGLKTSAEDENGVEAVMVVPMPDGSTAKDVFRKVGRMDAYISHPEPEVIINITGGRDSDVDSRNAMIRASIMDIVGVHSGVETYPTREEAVARSVKHLQHEYADGHLKIDTELPR